MLLLSSATYHPQLWTFLTPPSKKQAATYFGRLSAIPLGQMVTYRVY